MNIESLNFEFLNPAYFVLILLVPVVLYLFFEKQKKSTPFLFFQDLKEIYKKNNIFLYINAFLLTFIFIFYIIIFANPNVLNETEKITKNGIDIVITLDISTSMEATDLQPNRIEAAKQIILDFLETQETNRLGLVVFAGKPFVSIPLTFDYNILKETIENISTDNINQYYSELSGTAIGDAIVMSETLFNRTENGELRIEGNALHNIESQKVENLENREKVIILLTDGDANTGLEPKIASVDARDKGIKIYTIGIGSEEGAEIVYYSGPFQQTQTIPPLNNESLKEISEITSGENFRAIDNYSLEKIFEYLEKLEKNDIEIETSKLYTTKYTLFTNILLILLFLYLLNSLLRIER